MYKMFIRPLLFLVDAERIHHTVFSVLKVVGRIPGGRWLLSFLYGYNNEKLARTVCGIRFPNPVGLAAGFDKNAVLIDELSCLGFGFIEIGTLTPRPQAGNPKPRLFRLPVDHALINRMGFNNDGVLVAAESLKNRRSNVIVGGNIGKNKDTPNDLATDDYTYAFEVLYNYVDYFVLNVSSPNTPGLRALQEKEPLTHLLRHIKSLSLSRPNPKPVFLKIAPDLTEQQLNDIVEILQSTGTDGVIATNTTIARDGLKTSGRELSEIGAGGLSGGPLQQRSNEIIRYLRQRLGPQFPIIGVGGIMSVHDAIEKLQAGADLIQLYTGFIYEGPGFAKKINKALIAQLDALAK